MFKMWCTCIRILVIYSFVTLSQQRALRQQNVPNQAVPTTITGKTCKLPVEHAGKLYYSCVPDIDGHLWCPVSDNGDWEKCAQPNVIQQQTQQVQSTENGAYHQEKSGVNTQDQKNIDSAESSHQEAPHKDNQHQDQTELNEGHNSTFWMVDNSSGRMTEEGLPCIFPILYMGEVLYDCVSDVGGYEWCPTITGSWQRCAGSKDWLHEVAEKYVNQVDNLVVPNVGGWIPPIDSYNVQHQNQNSNHQNTNQENVQENNTIKEHREEVEIVDENPSIANEQQLQTPASTPTTQSRPKSTLNRKTLVEEQTPKQQDKSNFNSFTFALFSILPIVSILAIIAVLAESKYQIFEQTKKQLKNNRYIRKKWIKKHTVQIPEDIEYNAHRNNSERHLFQDYNHLRSDTQITAIKLNSSEGSSVTRRHTSNSGQQQNKQQNQNQNSRPDYHTRRSRSQVHFNDDDNNVHSVPSWIQNTDNSFWTDISGGVRNQGFVQQQELPQNWLSALEKVEQIQESRRAQSD